MRKLRHVLAVPLLVAVAALMSAAQARDVPYVPTPEAVVQKMLEMAEVRAGDVVYDLGSGDGRIVISAVRDFNATKAVGIDIDMDRITESTQNAKAAGVSDRAEFIRQDIFEADFSEATVLTMYLLSKVNMKLRPRILSELKPGTRVVSHQFSMGDWEPDKEERISSRSVYFWIVPADVGGNWRWTQDGREFRLDLTQSYQKVTGVMHTPDSGSTPVDIENASLVGDRLHVTAQAQHGGQTVEMGLSGRVEDGRLNGEFSVDGKSSTIEATRID